MEGLDVRPTTDKVKEAIFSSIQFELYNSDVLDLFAGSGQLGIEALSRGAQSAVFIDNSKKSIELVKKNLEKTKLIKQAQIFQMNSYDFLKQTNKKFDFIFLDEPISHLDEENGRIMSRILVEEADRQGAGIIVTSIGKHLELNYTKTLKL